MGRGSAVDAYDRMAPIYDEFNKANDYEVWLGEVLLPELEKHGLKRGRVLDVGCGTGRAFKPLLDRGWSVNGCDVSEFMLMMAEAKFPTVPVRHADATRLPTYDTDFDLIIALNDVVNYLTEDGDLELFFDGVRKNLAHQGLICFDANTLAVYEEAWVAGAFGAMRERGWEWTGLSESAAPGQVFEAEVGAADIQTAVHRQRHWPRSVVEDAMDSARLSCLAVLGQSGEDSEIVLQGPPDEARDAKLIYIAKGE